MKLGLCGNISLDLLATELDRDMPGSDIIVGRTDEFEKELSGALGEFAALDVCVLALDWRDIAPALYGFACGDDADAVTSGFRDRCADIRTCIGKFRNVCAVKLLIFSPISEHRSPTGFINRLLQPSPFELFNTCQNIFNEMCRTFPDVYPVDLEELSALIGKDNTFDPANRFKDLRPQPFSEVMTRAIADRINAICVQFQKYPLKCLVMDCDNTLWGGVVGETGPDNIVLSGTGPGKAYKAFQEEVVRLHKQGVMLAICSKNNTCDVLDVLEKHPHMLVRPSMISCFRINWDDKPKNMLQISAELNIGLDAMMFADDNPSERGMMAAALPEVTVLDLPASGPAYYADALRKHSRFWPLQLTRDDAAKGVFFSQEQKRRKSKELAANVEEYLVKSSITVTISRTGASLSRIAQLFNKTNQFNLTTKRLSESALSALMRVPDSTLFSMSMKDVYGDYGIIGAAIVSDDRVDSFLLSCRAFGKRAENAFLVFLLNFIEGRHFKHAFGRYAPTARNSMVKDFYKDLGFALEKKDGDDFIWRFDFSNKIPETPRWITVAPGG